MGAGALLQFEETTTALMPTGVIAALLAEARCLSARPIKPNNLTELEHGVLLWQCGVGAERAQQAARSLLDAGATALLSWGTAGGWIRPCVPETWFYQQPLCRARVSY